MLAFTLARPPAAPGPLARDFEAYYAAGATADAGADPYSRAIWSAESRVPGVDTAHDEMLPFVGPPATLPFWMLLARLPYSAALACWMAVLVAACATLIASGLCLANARWDAATLGSAALMAVAAAPMLGDFALGQAALVSAAALGAALVAYRARAVAPALAATLLAAVQPNLALALLGQVRSGWAFAIATTAAGVFAVLCLVAGGGPSGAGSYLARLAAHGGAERFAAIQHTPAAVAFALGATPAVAAALGTAVALAALGLTVALIVRERLAPPTAALLCCATLPLAIPFFHEHDFVLDVLPLLVLGARARGRARALAAAAAALLLVDWFGLAQRNAAAGQIIALGLAAVCAFVGLGRSRAGARFALAGPLALALLAAICVPLGRADPAPTWPADLPATFRADPGADISRIWADEGAATGLIISNPGWGALRALPLAGCIVLGAAVVVDARRRRRVRLRRRRALAPAVAPAARLRIEPAEETRDERR